MKRPLNIGRGAAMGVFIMVVAIVSSARSSDGAAEPILIFVVCSTVLVLFVGLSLMINRQRRQQNDPT